MFPTSAESMISINVHILFISLDQNERKHTPQTRAIPALPIRRIRAQLELPGGASHAQQVTLT